MKMRELRLQEPRGTYKAQRLLASQEAEEFAEASRSKKCPELYLLYVYAAKALKHAKSICLMSRRKERGSAKDFVLEEVRLAEYVDKLKDYPSLTDYLQEWPKNPGIVIAYFAGRSALEVIIKFTQAIRLAVVFGRGETACHGATSYDILQVSPKCDLRFAEWQERAINELCEKTIPKPDGWPSPADIHKECQQVLLKLEDEYNKAEKEAENKAAETEQGADKKIYKGEEAWEKFEEKLSEFGSLEIPFYPFKAGKIKYWNLTGKSDICKYGAYRFSKEDSAIIKNTVGSTFNVSTLRAYLSAECNVQNPDNYSWKDILAALEHKLKTKTISETEQKSSQEIIEVFKNWQESEKTQKDLEEAKQALSPLSETHEILCEGKDFSRKTKKALQWLDMVADGKEGFCRALLNELASPEVIADLEKWQEKPAEKADKQEKATTTSQPDSIVGDTWIILGIPINVKKLCTKLKSRPFLLICCLSLIVIIATYPLWYPLINKTDRDSSANYDPKESKVSGILETQTKRISIPNSSLQESVGTCEVIDIVKLFVEDVQGWARWDTGAQPGTPIAWITEGKYDDPPKDMGSAFGAFARNGAVVLTIKDKPIYRQLKQTVVPGTWDIWLVGPNGGVLVVKMESEYGKDLPFDISKVLKKSGFKVTLYKGLEVRNTTGNFIIYHIESPGGGKAWLAESWSIGTAGGTQEIWITYEQKYADILWEKEGSLGKQHLLWKQESNEVSRN